MVEGTACTMGVPPMRVDLVLIVLEFHGHSDSKSPARAGRPWYKLKFHISAFTRINSSYNCDIACGTTRTSPTTLMKFVSPDQRGTTC